MLLPLGFLSGCATNNVPTPGMAPSRPLFKQVVVAVNPITACKNIYKHLMAAYRSAPNRNIVFMHDNSMCTIQNDSLGLIYGPVSGIGTIYVLRSTLGAKITVNPQTPGVLTLLKHWAVGG